MSREELTAFGRWVRAQPRGTMNEIHLVTGIAYSTIHTALRRRVTVAIAEVLAQYTRGAVPLKEIRLPRRARRRAA